MNDFCRVRRKERYEACFDAVGVDDDEGPPVPIPNTEVKLIDGENTCLATDRENSKMPTLNRSYERSCDFLCLYSDKLKNMITRKENQPTVAYFPNFHSV